MFSSKPLKAIAKHDYDRKTIQRAITG